MKRIWLSCLLVLIIWLNHSILYSVTGDECSKVPIFISQTTPPPNILLILDNSASMYEFAYKDFDLTCEREGDSWCNQCTDAFANSANCPDNSFDPSKTYYGYFDPGKKYSYDTAGQHFVEDISGDWDGNFLNWLSMRRVEIVRKVLIGGRQKPRGVTDQTKELIGSETPDRDFYKKIDDATGYTPYSSGLLFEFDGTTGDFVVTVLSNTVRGSGGQDRYRVRIAVSEDQTGVIQEMWDKARFGLMYFNYGSLFEDGAGGGATGGSGNQDGGDIPNKGDFIDGPGENTDLVTQIQDEDPSTWTPLAESFYEAIRYFEASISAYDGNINYGPHDPIQDWCQKNFVIILTDGESSKDKNIPGGYWGIPVSSTENPSFDIQEWMIKIAENGDGYYYTTASNSIDGTYYLEGVAYYAHTTDLRSNLEDIQNLTTYTIFAFDESPVGKKLLQMTAKYGGFEDRNGNNIPDLQVEWDEDGDGLPDTYYEAQNGYQLENAIRQAIVDILKRASSGTAVSVLSTSSEGEGAIYQAYFKPMELRSDGTEVGWLGYLHSFWIDRNGNMREDTDGDRRLSIGSDKIFKFLIDEEGDLKIQKDINGDGIIDTNENFSLSELNPIWKAGDLLAYKEPEARVIYTYVDFDGDHQVDNDEFGSTIFTSDNAANLTPYLDSNGNAEEIINFIRGVHIEGLRDRRLEIDGDLRVWKLGDIVYSTPTIVSKPMNDYQLIYGDETYSEFYITHKNRRTVIYVGANDGMLHAFNGGYYHEGNDGTTSTTEQGWFTKCPNGDTPEEGCNPVYELGEELWAYIPYNLLPHLKWLSDPDYSHVYYVDLKTKAVDARIFENDEDHPTSIYPNGWGTVLIGGMRLGGCAYTVEADFDSDGDIDTRTFRSAYFALDVTDPLNPKLLWEFTHSELGFTTSYPAVFRLGEKDASINEQKWYVVFGSGPGPISGIDLTDALNYHSNQQSSLFVLDLKTGDLIKRFALDNDAFMANPIGVDLGLDYQVNVGYIGEVYQDPATGKEKGKIYRFLPQPILYNGFPSYKTDPDEWTYSTLISGLSPITSAPSATLDFDNHLWIYFGTGRYFSEEDKTDTTINNLYGIIDPCAKYGLYMADGCITSVTEADLIDVTYNYVYIDQDTGKAYVHEDLDQDGEIDEDEPFTYFDLYLSNVRTSYLTLQRYGWKHELINEGEKCFVKPSLMAGSVLFPTFIPNTAICSFGGGESQIYTFYFETGTGYKKPIIGSVYGLGEEVPYDNATYKESLKIFNLDNGMPSSIGIHLDVEEEQGTGLIQLSTGMIKQIQLNPPLSIKSKSVSWRERE